MSDHPKNVPALIKDLDPTVQQQRLWCDQQIAEKKYLLANVRAEIDRFIQGTIKGYEADCIRYEREIAELIKQKENLDQFGNNEVVDVTKLPNK